MAIQIINTGTSANAGNGDSIRTAFNKVNQNFDFLNGAIIGSSTTFTSSVQSVVKPMLVHDAHIGVTSQYNAVNDRIVLSVSGFRYNLTSGTSTLLLQNDGSLILDQQGAYTGSDVPGTLIRVDTDQPNYTQATLQNFNDASTATSDLIIARNDGSVEDGAGVLDIGINSTNYEDVPFGIHTPGSAYVFTNDADLVIGTQTPGSRLIFHAGGTSSSDSAGVLDGYAWRFNRSVQVIVPTPGPLNFTVWNTQDNSASQAVYQAINNAGHILQLGINSDNPNASYGSIGPTDGFIHINGTTSTLHIGSTGDLMFWSDEPNGGYESGVTATLVMSRLDRSSTFGGHVLPAEDLAYDLGSTSSQWRSLYVGTSTVYFGGIPLTVDANGSIVVNGNVVNGNVVSVTAPLSSTSTGTAGTIAYDSSFFYVCTETDIWRRIAWDNTPW